VAVGRAPVARLATLVGMSTRAQGLRFARLATLAGAVALAGTAACAGGEEPREEEVAAEERRAEARQAWRAPATVVLDIVREEVTLRADQEEELAALAAEYEGEGEGFRALHEDLRLAAADAVRAGRADREELDRAVAEGLLAVEERIQHMLDGIEDLHAILDADQRAAVAEAQARREERRAERRAARAAGEDGFGRFASYLVLSRTQVDKLMTLRKELVGEDRRVAPSRAELDAVIDAFEGDDVRPALDALHETKSRMMRMRIARASDKADTVLSIFTESQRELLADLIIEGPEKMLLGEDAIAQAR
jgi:hypothetical protein